ncbi:mycothione reductase [Pseudonocardia sulfidoxydans NBRC 16205]|uniref:Mycothione reductase n=1 Tax=Pseudonocardia sulfidoxydans NBRC 16205 TaxID=1223511 RepID=A0A511D9N6_9PSEU|nr:mycothione reductase [Pseudonocardia sulfidoxydans]GEL21512.1 mycothione reductase [Pseudonocardia sulfidoxydans NBRC 16205]
MRHHDLLVIGAGSGNAVVDDSFADLDVAIVEQDRFGGTCLNVGCIPTKMLVRAADLADDVADSARLDVDAELRGIRWRDLRDRVFGRLDPLARDGKTGREDTPWITVYDTHARFTAPRTLDIGGTAVSADRIVVAAGSRPMVPPPVTDSGLPYETSDTVMRVDDPPRRLAVLGGGYIAAELAHVFSSAGSAITVIDMADTLLAGQDVLVAREFTELASKAWDVRLDREVTAVSGAPGALVLTLDDESTVEADMLLVAVGRVPNGDGLDLDTAGIDVHDDGRIVVDEYQRTTADGVWALGDVSTKVPLKHVANREADVVRHNLRHPDDLHTTGDAPVPSAIFTSPQIAAVGATEQELTDSGTPFRVGLARVCDVAYGWAMEDTTGFAKVLADPGTGTLLGAHILGPQASTLIQPLVLAMTLELDALTLVEQPYWIHPALSEVVKQALKSALS